MPNREISTSDIVLDALRQDKKVFIPYIYSSKDNPKTKIMDMLRLRDEEDLRSLGPDAWGIPSLSANDVELRENAMGGFGLSDHLSQPKSSGSPGLDLIFMPGMAFDKLNHRLGHGKGFYDRYISRLHQKDSAESSSRTNPALGKLLVRTCGRVIRLKNFIVGLALREQLLPEGENVPVDDWDRQIDQLIISD